MKNLVISIFLLFFIVLSCTNRDGEIIDLINSVKKQNDDLKAQITSLKKTTDSAMVAITKVTVSQAVTDKKLDAIQTELKSVLAQISSLSTQMTAANADLASIKAKLDALQAKCAELVAQIATLTTTLNSTLVDLKKQVATLKNTSDSALIVITKLSAAQASSDKNIVSLQAELKNVVSQLADLSSQLGTSNVDITSLKSKIDALQIKVNELIAEITLIKISIFSTVTSKTGRIWMDRNLGATQVATSPKDEKSYGYYYQWGRGNDGHQVPNSSTTSVRSQLDQPGHNLFILVPGPDNLDWKVSPNPNLWQGVSGINNVCPIGFRVPTNQEWQQEKNTWSSPTAEGGFTSVLKLPLPGNRNAQFGNLSDPGLYADYWTSSVQNDRRGVLLLTTKIADIYYDPGSYGYSVRCIKD